jgi:glutathionylspermidine synthase
MDSNTIAEHVLVITEQEQKELETLTDMLDKETIRAEEIIIKNQKPAKPLSLPWKIRKELKKAVNYQANRHIRLKRYDFHPTMDGKWALSEVNSDVPGGFAEASVMPEIAASLFKSERYDYINFGEILTSAIAGKVKPHGKIILVHCTSYSDDRQVMQFLGDKLQNMGYEIIYAAADHLRFENNEAISLLDGNAGKIDAIIRFTPIEWLVKMRGEAMWSGYFDTTTVSCNHPIAVYAQTKRFPLVWDLLEKHGACFTTWRELLPETLEVKAARKKEGFIFKPVYGRVGENISIKEACREGEYERIIKDVKRNPKKYLAQKRFDSKPVQDENGEKYHLCLGSFTVEGKAAGYYARISKTPRIDSNAADIPVLIEKKLHSVGNRQLPSLHSYAHSRIRAANERAPPSMAALTECTDGNRLPPTECNNQIESAYSTGMWKSCYKAWAPANIKWSKWVRPVPFIINETKKAQNIPYDSPGILYLENIPPDTAIILDLPGYSGILEGVALARKGLRPVPLYNGTTEQHGAIALVDNTGINSALLRFSYVLNELGIKDDAPPVFMLDSDRMNRYKVNVSVFDNSWDVYEQDMPSPEFLLNNGINSIILCGYRIQRDIHKILYKYQSKGITILYTSGIDPPSVIGLKKPPREKDN